MSAYLSQEEEILNAFSFWRALFRHWILMAIVFLTITLGTIAASLLMTSYYRADALLSPANTEGGGGGALSQLASSYTGLASMAGISLPSGDTGLGERLEIMRSHWLTQKFVTTYHLLPILFPERWDAETGSWKANGSSAAGQAPSEWETYEKFDSLRQVARDPTTGLVTLSIEWKDASTAATWANGLVALANREMRDRAVAEAQRGIAYLSARLDNTQVADRRQMLIGLMEAQERKIVMATSADQYAFEVVDAATPPKEHIRPKRSVMAIAGAIAGLVLAIIAAILADLFTQIRTRSRRKDPAGHF